MDFGTLEPSKTVSLDDSNIPEIRGNPKRLGRGFTTGVQASDDEMFKDENRAHTNNEMSPEEDLRLENREDLKKKLQIFQSESKWEEYEYDEASLDYKMPQGEVCGFEDEDIKSGFNSELKEQFKKVHV